MYAINKRISNLTLNRVLICTLTTLIMFLGIKMMCFGLHITIHPWMGALAYVMLLAARLWKVGATPPPQSYPSDLFPRG